ncbi:MAG TPA: hypothetical protein VNM69_14190 [Bacillus sp. (in: firmicutes)]|uniref:hypothetical protein n=1 Tax=Bacillus litorisediminis TaxID=2922713 RepID=UPI001FACAE98|nr:hypothetical protein [Bacillus litorisediminis]HWO77022.1 hypothetical protein [Bacillus sp. (in: firmicutes)]
MSRQIKAIVTFSILDVRYAVQVFWAILIGFMLLGVGITMSFNNSLSFAGSGIAMYIFCAITGFQTVKESFPFSIKMGGTRKNYFVSMCLFFTLLSLLMSLIHNVFLTAYEKFLDVLNLQIFTFHFSMITGLEDTWILRFFIDSVIAFFLLNLLFFVGIMFYRFGLIGGYSVIGIIVLFFFIPGVSTQVLDFIFGFASVEAVMHYIWLIVISLLILVVNWAVMRKAPVYTANIR